ncbi:hypothetical protein [Mycolicibacterium neworleansense]|uniref:Aminoglycoside phosphotransferase domain-containing protein n=1 Tax=Mycolicibacterium neworleansense TaxID=146018 RepID=A0A0H5RGH9_9MYCO|nr:hypothetical protein [Mycolicibacterium neworleansense]MCV7362328.1 hypothetical protein [Mycolicibacterium neworleansense]CRZ13260.1 hypothetical protein BN2156_00090 [Mycolicibacterium neworleansense]
MQRWVIGDGTGLEFPADPDTLRSAGPDFLTSALHTFGALPQGNRITEITRFQECAGGSTGRKALLDVRYADPADLLPSELFVKFSRDFDNSRRDRGKSQMELEVAFGALSAGAELPVTVPVCLFADYHAASCTGMLLTERIAFGTSAVERHYDKCLDYRMPDALGHYRALLTSVARLAGAHRSGRLPDNVTGQFRYDAAKVTVGARTDRSPDELAGQVRRLTAFADRYPALLPTTVGHPEFTDRMLADVGRIAGAEDAIMSWLHTTVDQVALCHWNANVDNAWFWSEPDGTLKCGLMDWGCVSVMNVAMALWGSLCSAETEIWEQHLDGLLEHFAAEFHAAGGPALDTARLRTQLVLYAAVMGVAWLLDAPAHLEAALPDQNIDRFDARIADNESVRAQLLMLSNFLRLWETQDFGALLDEFERR